MSLKHAEFDTTSAIAFGSLTTSDQVVATLSNDVDQLFLLNSTNSLVIVVAPQLVSGVVVYRDFFRLPANTFLAYDGRANKKTICKGEIRARYSGTAPTSGEFSVTGLR